MYSMAMAHEYDHKAWNYSVEFDIFISPQKNLTVPLKDQRFDRLTHCCVTLLHHIERFKEFLEKMSHVTNQLTSISRSFYELEFMPILMTLGAIIGLHLINPFLSLTMSTKTSYSDLIEIFPKMYEELKNPNPSKFLQTEKPALSFVSENRFKQCKYKEELLTSLNNFITEHGESLKDLLNKLLPRLGEAFQNQKGHIFGFGNINAKEEYRVDLLEASQLENVPINNIAEERSVGYVNHELKVRGPQGFNKASDSLMKSKSIDLIQGLPSGSFNDFRQTSKKIKVLKLQWSQKQKELSKERLNDKELANINLERKKKTKILNI